jgi:predicted nucleic-acid-binding Zn-ribbon protein
VDPVIEKGSHFKAFWQCPECTNARDGSSSIEMATTCLHDIEAIEFYPLKCSFRIFKV